MHQPAPRKNYRHTVDGFVYDAVHRFKIDGSLIVIEVNAVCKEDGTPATATLAHKAALSEFLNVPELRLFFACGIGPTLSATSGTGEAQS